MTPEAQRIAIAEACGWKNCAVSAEWFGNVIGHPPSGWSGTMRDERLDLAEPPDYLTDLNAMHEAEKVLTSEKWTEYWHHLFDINRKYQGSISAPSVLYMINSTAAQRAEAFLRTLGKWNEGGSKT